MIFHRSSFISWIITLFFILWPCGAYAITCPTGSTTYTTTTGGGNYSATSTWVGGVVPVSNGNGACITVQGPLVIDVATIGTNAGTGVLDIITIGTWSISFSTGNHAIYFGSTGSDPCGSGGTSAAPLATATMHGFYLQGTGSLNLTSATNGITVTSADGVHPWYASSVPSAGGLDNITIKQASLSHLGASTECSGDSYPYFAGITLTDNALGTVTLDMENNLVSDYYEAAFLSGSNSVYGNLTYTSNTSSGRRGLYTVYTAYSVNTVTNQNNTESAPSAAGAQISMSGSVASYAGGGNLSQGNSAYAIQAVNGPSLPNNAMVSGDAVLNDATQAGSTAPFTSCFTVSGTGIIVSGNYAENCNASFTGAATFSGNFGITNHLATQGQGVYVTYDDTARFTGNGCIITEPSQSSGLGCIFAYSLGIGTTTPTTDHNTLVGTLGGTGQEQGITNGDSGSGYNTNASVSFNLIYNMSYAAIADQSTGPNIYVTSGTGGVGVWNNATYSLATYGGGGAYGIFNSTPLHFDNGTNHHPYVGYGDVDGFDPAFLDKTRTSMDSYAKRVLGLSGVSAFVTQMGYRSGWGGTYSLGPTPITNAIAWFFAGLTPNNAAMCPGGATIGAIACSSTIVNRIIPME